MRPCSHYAPVNREAVARAGEMGDRDSTFGRSSQAAKQKPGNARNGYRMVNTRKEAWRGVHGLTIVTEGPS